MLFPRTPGFSATGRALRCGLMLLGVLMIPGMVSAAAPGWKGAVAKSRITPDVGMWMAGYASRTKPSDGIVQDLFAKVLVLEDGQQHRQVFVTLDLISVPRPLREFLEKALKEQYGLAPESLLMNCSHTHSGPELRITRATADDSSGGDINEASRTAQAIEYSSRLQKTLVDSIGDCLKRLEPVNVGISHARCGFAMNRRLPVDGGYRNSPYPDGPVDHDVPVLRIEQPSGELLGLMFGYACHNTTVGFYQINGDYAGYAQQYLEEAHPGSVALFMMGCAGDQNPYPRGKTELCEQHGRTLANAVEAALLPRARPLSGVITSAIGTAELEFAPLPSKARLEQLAQSKNKYEAGHARRLLARMNMNEAIDLKYPYLVQVVRLGTGCTLVALSGEVVVDYSLRLKKELASEPLWVAGYSNDVFGYVPSLRVLREGGYEGAEAMIYTSFPGPFAESVEERIVDKVHELIRSTAAVPVGQ